MSAHTDTTFFSRIDKRTNIQHAKQAHTPQIKWELSYDIDSFWVGGGGRIAPAKQYKRQTKDGEWYQFDHIQPADNMKVNKDKIDMMNMVNLFFDLVSLKIKWML